MNIAKVVEQSSESQVVRLVLLVEGRDADQVVGAWKANPVVTFNPAVSDSQRILDLSQTSAPIVVRAATALFVTELLTSTGSKEPYRRRSWISHLAMDLDKGHLPTCSAFSTLRRILEGLSGPGNTSSVPAEGPVPVTKICSDMLAHGSNVGAVAAYLWTERWMLEHDRAVAEFLNKTIFPLNGSIRHFGNFVAIETIPALTSFSLDEVDDVVRVFEVDEGIAHIAVVCKVDTKVHEVVLPMASLVDNCLQHGLEEVSGSQVDMEGGRLTWSILLGMLRSII